jgi:hypothetical protein
MTGPAAGARVWLDVAYSEKDQAKTHGARWDSQAKRWYDPHPPTPGLTRWAALPDIPELLPGEGRSFGTGLFVDLVPVSCWFTNVRSCVSAQDWERLRRMITRRAGQRCEICGRPEDRHLHRWLEAHERWTYTTTGAVRVQKLCRLICLCTDCHQTTHYGHAQITGHAEEALSHLCAVTGMNPAQAELHIVDACALWEQRSRHQWTLDLHILTDAGVTITPCDRGSR